MSKLPSERIAILATIDPDAYGTGTQTSDWASVEEFHQVFAVVEAGILAASATLDAKLMQATSSTGAGAKVVSTANAQITQLDTGDNDKQAIMNLRTDSLDVAGGFSFVALRMTLTTAGGDCSGVLFGVDPRHGPADDFDLASVAEIKSA